MVTKKRCKVRKLSFLKKIRIFLLCVFCLSHYTLANSQPIFEGWSRASPLGAKNAAVYGSFHNPTQEKIELSEVVFEHSESAALHHVVREKDFAKMRPLGLSLGPKQKFDLEFIQRESLIKEIFTICKSGKRSEKASKILSKFKIQSRSIGGGIEKLKRLLRD